MENKKEVKDNRKNAVNVAVVKVNNNVKQETRNGRTIRINKAFFRRIITPSSQNK